MWAIAFGETIEEARANFRESLTSPDLAINIAVRPIPPPATFRARVSIE
jgi:hypothetical protein